MPPTRSQPQAWDIGHLINAANYWTKMAITWENIFAQRHNRAHTTNWEGRR